MRTEALHVSLVPHLVLPNGPAFNLLEVNLTIEPRPGKVQQANFLLVKK
jgi:hypothetical protein